MICVRTLLIAIALIAQTASANSDSKNSIFKASFDETYDRYPSPYALIEQFKHIVPFSNSYDECLTMGEKGAPVSGVIDPLQNGALEQEPGPMFYQYYQTCVRGLVDFGFSNAIEDNLNAILGESLKLRILTEMTDLCKDPLSVQEPLCIYYSIASLESPWMSVPWQSYPESIRRELIRAMISYLVGPEIVLRAQGYIGEQTAFGHPVVGIEGLVQMLLDETSQDLNGRRTYFKAVYAEIAIILRLGPALKA